MPYDPRVHHRRSIRLDGYDYSQPGAYFVTICTYEHRCLFGRVTDGEMRLNEYGEIVAECWRSLPERFSGMVLDAFSVMPNHIHGILVVIDPRSSVGAGSPRPVSSNGGVTASRAEGAETAPLLGQIVAYFKYQCAKRVNLLRCTPGVPLWQRNYYDRVIRNERSLQEIREYIAVNPVRWELDELHPDRNRRT